MKKIYIAFYGLLFFCVFSNFTYAQTIKLLDGSVVKGEILKQKGDFLQVKTKYGELKIKRQEVESINGNSKTIYMQDGTVLKGTVKGLEAEILNIETDYGQVDIKQKDIDYISFSNLPLQKKKSGKKMRFKLFFEGEGFLAGNADDGWENYLKNYSGIYSYNIDQNNSIGGRLGLLFETGKKTYLGISAGYIQGPNLNARSTALSYNYNPYYSYLTTHSTYSLKRKMVRGLVELRKELWFSRLVGLNIGGGVGMAYGKQKLTSTSNNKTAKYSVFTWEASAAILLKSSGFSDAHFGVRYMSFPEISAVKDTAGNTIIPKMKWNAVGVYCGISF